MAGPWDKYKKTPSTGDSSPWAKYSKPSTPDTNPSPDKNGVFRTGLTVASKAVPGFSFLPDETQKSIIDKGTKAISNVSSVATTPIRGMRGVGVGAQRIIEGDSPSDALNRAAAATKPGYVPGPGEKIGAFGGEMLATAPFLAAMGGGPLATQALKGAASSGILTSIMGSAESGDIGIDDAFISTAFGGAAPYILGPAMAGVGKIARSGGKKLMSSIFGPSEEALSARFRRPADIKGAKSIEDIAGAVSKGLTKLSNRVRELDDRAWETLKLKDQNADDVLDILHSVKRSIGVVEGKPIGVAQKKAVSVINDMISDVEGSFKKPASIIPGPMGSIDPPKIPRKLSQEQVRSIIKAADENINWDDPRATVANEALVDFRMKLSNHLKATNPEFEKVMAPLAKRTELLSELSRTFSIGKEAGIYSPKDTATGKLKTATREGRVNARTLLRKLKATTGQDTLKEMSDSLIADEFIGGRPNGSRNTLAGGAMGASLGFLLGDGRTGTASTLAGMGVGNLIDRYGGNMAGSIIDQLARIPTAGARRLMLSPSMRAVLQAAESASRRD